MSQRKIKQTRHLLKKHIRVEYNNLASSLAKEPFLWRVWFCFQIMIGRQIVFRTRKRLSQKEASRQEK